MKRLRPARDDRRRDLAADVRWGISQALWLTAICLIPAAVVCVAQRAFGTRDSFDLSVLQVLLLYGTIALAGGAVLGLFRPALRTRAGSVFVGGAIGAIAFTILVWDSAASAADAPVVRVVGAALGGLTGSSLAAYAWRLSRGLR